MKNLTETTSWLRDNLRQQIYLMLQHKSEQTIAAKIPAELVEPGGAFVSIYFSDQLRGCIGRMQSNQPPWRTIAEMGVAACTSDHRFDPVSAGELLNSCLHVSILSPLTPVDNIADIKTGRDGIYMTDGTSSGVYLPQVATKQGWTTLQMLEHCAHDKAGIGYNGWKRADLFTFQADTIIINPT